MPRSELCFWKSSFGRTTLSGQKIKKKREKEENPAYREQKKGEDAEEAKEKKRKKKEQTDQLGNDERALKYMHEECDTALQLPILRPGRARAQGIGIRPAPIPKSIAKITWLNPFPRGPVGRMLRPPFFALS
jgi:hypothetical protein